MLTGDFRKRPIWWHGVLALAVISSLGAHARGAYAQETTGTIEGAVTDRTTGAIRGDGFCPQGRRA